MCHSKVTEWKVKKGKNSFNIASLKLLEGKKRKKQF